MRCHRELNLQLKKVAEDESMCVCDFFFFIIIEEAKIIIINFDIFYRFAYLVCVMAVKITK